MVWSPRRQYITAMTTSPSQDPQARAQAQAEWRTLKMVRTGGALVVMAAMVVFGIVGLAVGQEGSGFTALFIGGIGMVLTVVARTLRRRRGGS
jgi:Na+/melibiose symporter-like transporter